MPASPADPSAIAGVTGGHREWTPPAVLRGTFGQLWRSDLPANAGGTVTVLPDGCVDVLYREGRLYVVGPDIVAARPALAPGTQLLGARFAPGAARAWLGVPLAEILGTAVDLETIIGVRARQMATRLEDVDDTDVRQQLFAHQLAALPHVTDRRHAAAASLFTLVRNGGIDLRVVATTLHLSTRSLRRMCHEQFGYGPKMLERVLRLQRFLSQARAQPHAGLAVLAADVGYADQSHLSREVRALTGMGAATLRAQWCR